MNDLSSSAGFTVLGDTDTKVTFGYDYSADGIPSAPNGSGTTGLKMEANLEAPAQAASAAVVTSLNLPAGSTSYRVTFDVWSNFAINGGGSTEFAGGGIGHDAATVGLNGASMIMTGDGGSSRDYRLYKDSSEQFVHSGQYNPALTSNNNSDATLSSAFPAVAPPAAQSQIGSNDSGDSGFQWMTMQIDVDPTMIGVGTTTTPGVASFTLTSAASGNTVLIGTFDNSDGGTPVDMDENFAFLYADVFTSVASDPALNFGVYDNLRIETTVPEPSSSMLLALTGLCLVARRSR